MDVSNIYPAVVIICLDLMFKYILNVFYRDYFLIRNAHKARKRDEDLFNSSGTFGLIIVCRSQVVLIMFSREN